MKLLFDENLSPGLVAALASANEGSGGPIARACGVIFRNPHGDSVTEHIELARFTDDMRARASSSART